MAFFYLTKIIELLSKKYSSVKLMLTQQKILFSQTSLFITYSSQWTFAAKAAAKVITPKTYPNVFIHFIYTDNSTFLSNAWKSKKFKPFLFFRYVTRVLNQSKK